jgi:predicted anti-sigma-YlaC factor YlaD
MSCKDDITKLLPWYVNGTLSEDEQKRVQDHLKICERCRKYVKHIQWFFAGMEEYRSIIPEGHIDPEKLVLFAESKHELQKTEIEEIKKHLEKCAACRSELKILSQVNAELGMPSSSQVETRKTPGGFLIQKPQRLFSKMFGRLRGTKRQWGRKPILAYVAYLLVIILLYPAWLGLQGAFFGPKAPGDTELMLVDLKTQNQTLDRQLQEKTQLLKLYEGSSNVRVLKLKYQGYRSNDQASQEVINIEEKDSIINVAFQVPITDRDCQYNLQLYLEDNLKIIQNDIKPKDEQGNFIIPIAASSLIAGRYQLKLTVIFLDHTDEFFFDFKINMR